MAIDYETVRANAERPAPGNDWSEREQAVVQKMRDDMAKQREQEQHERDCSDFASYAVEKALDARQRGYNADAKVWDEAVVNIGKGVWTHAPSINADPAITRFQPLRTRLAYAGKMVQFTDK